MFPFFGLRFKFFFPSIKQGIFYFLWFFLFLLLVVLFEFLEYLVEIDQCSPAQFAYLGGVVLGFRIDMSSAFLHISWFVVVVAIPLYVSVHIGGILLRCSFSLVLPLQRVNRNNLEGHI